MTKEEIQIELQKLNEQYETHKFLAKNYRAEYKEMSAKICENKVSHVVRRIEELKLLLNTETPIRFAPLRTEFLKAKHNEYDTNTVKIKVI